MTRQQKKRFTEPFHKTPKISSIHLVLPLGFGFLLEGTLSLEHTVLYYHISQCRTIVKYISSVNVTKYERRHFLPPTDYAN